MNKRHTSIVEYQLKEYLVLMDNSEFRHKQETSPELSVDCVEIVPNVNNRPEDPTIESILIKNLILSIRRIDQLSKKQLHFLHELLQLIHKPADDMLYSITNGANVAILQIEALDERVSLREVTWFVWAHCCPSAYDNENDVNITYAEWVEQKISELRMETSEELKKYNE
jgi:hypothetical protein